MLYSTLAAIGVVVWIVAAAVKWYRNRPVAQAERDDMAEFDERLRKAGILARPVKWW